MRASLYRMFEYGLLVSALLRGDYVLSEISASDISLVLAKVLSTSESRRSTILDMSARFLFVAIGRKIQFDDWL
jgi:hypothetical protein